MRHKPLIVAACILLGACAPKLGDSCNRATDCSANGDRVCDEAQPGGYCTIANCEPGTCGDEGLCVRFRPDEPRLSSQWCMAKCGSDCDRGAYTCKSAEELNSEAQPNTVGANESTARIAVVLDSNVNGKFCVVNPARAGANTGSAEE
ncbi:MAG: hypothetical protein ABW252_21830 [Polyangiales bacterium]